jgi:hypothetical protein
MRHEAPVVFPVDFDGGEHVFRGHPINVRFVGGSAMAWAGICHDGRTQLKIAQGTLNAVKYRDDILDPIALPFLQHRNFGIKAYVILFHSCTYASRSSCSVSSGF